MHFWVDFSIRLVFVFPVKAMELPKLSPHLRRLSLQPSRAFRPRSGGWSLARQSGCGWPRIAAREEAIGWSFIVRRERGMSAERRKVRTRFSVQQAITF
jgi:hypothetical protein